jgi:hypothetical protein
MARQPVPTHALDWAMAAAARAVGIDVLGAGTMLDHYVNVHAVEEMDSAAYRYRSPGWVRIARSGSLREVSTQLCLGQALGGDSAYTVFHCADLDPILDTLGSRGYHQYTYSAPLSSPWTFSLVPIGGPTACVWELAIHSYEREAYIKHALDPSTGPDIDAYLTDMLV